MIFNTTVTFNDDIAKQKQINKTAQAREMLSTAMNLLAEEEGGAHYDESK